MRLDEIVTGLIALGCLAALMALAWHLYQDW